MPQMPQLSEGVQTHGCFPGNSAPIASLLEMRDYINIFSNMKMFGYGYNGMALLRMFAVTITIFGIVAADSGLTITGPSQLVKQFGDGGNGVIYERPSMFGGATLRGRSIRGQVIQ